MKIIQILPEFNVGGVEQHVLWLSNELSKKGHEVLVVSAGGTMQSRLLDPVFFKKLPVDKKNPVTALFSSLALARMIKREKWDVLHAHSRVPFWISLWVSRFTKCPFVVTAHSCYSKNHALYPLKKADTLIAVSRTVRDHLADYLPSHVCIAYNGLPKPRSYWKAVNKGENRFLFLGRLSRSKGLQFFIEAISYFRDRQWHLDVVGDGPMREELKKLVSFFCISEKVTFHGFSENTEYWMANCSCFVFPSLDEGMGLTLMQSILMDVPVLASDIPAVRELSFLDKELIKPGSVPDWIKALDKFFKTGVSGQKFDKKKIPLVNEMANKVEDLYRDAIRRKASYSE